MKFKVKDYVKIGLKEKLIIFSPAVVLAILAFVFAYYFVDPFPPRRISIGCGPPEGANFKYAQAYREILAKEGISLELRSTAGSAENLKLLGAASGGVDVAFVQGSMKSLVPKTDLVSLGSLFFEPLWIFHRNDLALRRISGFERTAACGRKRRRWYQNFDHAVARTQRRQFTKYSNSFIRLPEGRRYAFKR